MRFRSLDPIFPKGSWRLKETKTKSQKQGQKQKPVSKSPRASGSQDKTSILREVQELKKKILSGGKNHDSDGGLF